MQLFSNNASTTLSAQLLSGATSASVTSGSAFTSPDNSKGQYELLTISSTAGIEIVKMTARSGGTLTVTRAQEGTTALTHPSGGIVEGRVTAGTLSATAQGLINTGNARGYGAVDLQSTRTDTQVASGTGAVAVGSQNTASGSSSTAVGIGNAATATNALAAGVSSAASNQNALGLGSHASATGRNSIALGGGSDDFGTTSSASGLSSIAMGGGNASGEASLAIGRFSRSGYDYCNNLSGLQFAVSDDYNQWTGWEQKVFGTTEIVLLSLEIDLITSPAWQASHAYIVGDIVRPVTPNTYMYRCISAGTSGSSEPTWDTTRANTVSDNTVTWENIGTLTQAIIIPTGVKFYPDEAGVIVTSATTVTGQPSVSFGGDGGTATLLGASACSGLTAAGARQRFSSLLTGAGQNTLSGTVTAVATATKLRGRFYWRGLLVESQA